MLWFSSGNTHELYWFWCFFTNSLDIILQSVRRFNIYCWGIIYLSKSRELYGELKFHTSYRIWKFTNTDLLHFPRLFTKISAENEWLLRKPGSGPWTRTQKTLGPEKPGPWKTWKTAACIKMIKRPLSIFY